MPGGFPIAPELCNGIASGTGPGTSGSVSVSSSSSSNTKGSWVTIIAATSIDACYLGVTLEACNGLDQFLWDIAVGAAGQEKIIVANLAQATCDGEDNFTDIMLPIQIAAGSRIAARNQYGTSGGSSGFIRLHLFEGSFTQMDGVAGAEGVSSTLASTSSGTTVGAPSSTSKGSYAQLVAATVRDYVGFYIITDGSNVGTDNCRGVVDVAIGASGQEKIIVPDAGMTITFHGFQSPNQLGPFWIPIPAGTRVAARLATDQGVSVNLQVALMAMYL